MIYLFGNDGVLGSDIQDNIPCCRFGNYDIDLFKSRSEFKGKTIQDD